MKDFYEELVSILERLYDSYERYMWKNDDSSINVLMQDNTISFYLNKNNDVMDEFILNFNEEDHGIYAYICIRLIMVMLGNVIIHIDDNMVYNNVHKPYLKVIVNDEGIINSMERIIRYQNKIVIHGKMEILEMVKERLPMVRYPKRFMKNLDERVELSRKLLRGGRI